jgi:hypothetical protein
MPCPHNHPVRTLTTDEQKPPRTPRQKSHTQPSLSLEPKAFSPLQILSPDSTPKVLMPCTPDRQQHSGQARDADFWFRFDVRGFHLRELQFPADVIVDTVPVRVAIKHPNP